MTHRFTPEQLAFLRRRIAMPRDELAELFNHQFGQHRSTDSIADVMQYNGWYRYPHAPVFQRMNQSGYLEERQSNGRMRAARYAMWEATICKIPPGYTLIPVYGDRIDLDPFNWVMVSRREQVHLHYAGFATAPHELKPSILALARLRAAVMRATGKRARSRRWQRAVKSVEPSRSDLTPTPHQH